MAFSSNQWAFAFGVLANILSGILYLAPVPTFFRIYKKKSTKGFLSIPYVVGLLSGMLWLYYAFLKPNTNFLITINSFGCIIETIYICLFLFHGTKKARVETVQQFVLLVTCGLGLSVLFTYFLARGSTHAHVVGWICQIFATCVFIAPLCMVRQVVRTKSTEYMPLPLSAFLALSAVAWFFYGLLVKDSNIAIPNVLGFIFCLLQMRLNKRNSKSDKDKDLENQNNISALADQLLVVEDNRLSDQIVILEANRLPDQILIVEENKEKTET